MRQLLSAVLCLSLLAYPGTAPRRYVALTFDDGPSGRFTEALVDGLNRRNVQATFFLCGYRLEQYPQQAALIHNSGHEIGCHGYSHTHMTELGHRALAQEITDTLDLLPLGTQVQFLRPPGGIYDEKVSQIAAAKQLAVVTWSLDPEDWAKNDPTEVRKFVVSHVQDGDVILMHDMSDSSVTAALAIVDDLQGQGYTFVTLSQLTALRGCQPKPGKVYTCFPPE